MSIVTVVLQVLLGLVFLGAGASKIAGAKSQVVHFDHWRLPQWFRPVVGTVEVAGALGIVTGVAFSWVGAVAAFWLGCVMVGALLNHVRIRDAARNYVPPAVLLCGTAIVLALQWSSVVGQVP